jgi:GTPase SAR1 family protein
MLATKCACLILTLDSPGDVGGQKTLRTYWKNYFEKTDTLIWVVDSTDAARLDDCREELFKLLLEEVSYKGQTLTLVLQLIETAVDRGKSADIQE